MHIAYTPEQEALRAELRAYFTELMTPEVSAAAFAGNTGDPACIEAVKQMGRDRWLGVGWPTEYGGRGFGPVEQFIFMNESWRAGAPTPFLSVNTVGQTIMQFGSQEQKDFFLPKILAGDLHFSIGYTEPESGTDLASLTTRAVKDGDEWVINGQKIFTSLASYADYIWLAARTDPEAPKHKGITIFAVPTSDPGYSFTKIETMVNASTFNTFYDDVRVPDSAIIGELHGGWNLIVNQLNYERVGLAPPGIIEGPYEDVLNWAREHTTADGAKLIDQPWVQANLAQVRAGTEYLRLLNWKVAALEAAGEAVNPADASSIKVFGTEFFLEALRLLTEIIGPAALLEHDSPATQLGSRLSRAAQGSLILTFGGGVNEIQRDLIAMFGLGMPRMPHVGAPVDFTISEEQKAIAELAGRIFTDKLPAERLKEIEGSQQWLAADVWAELAKADLLGIALPEAHGGGGYTFFELALILEKAGETVAPLPLLSTIVMAALPIAEFGSAEQQGSILPAVINGERFLAAALTEGFGSLPPSPEHTATTASADGDGWVISGTKTLVAGADLASMILVPATTAAGELTVFLLDVASPGVTLERNVSINLEPMTNIVLDGVHVTSNDVLGSVGGGAPILDWITARTVAANCALATGVCEAATRITGSYTSQRKQFDTPIATFQAVAHRVADAYIDTEGVRLTSRQAAWRLAEGLDATEALAIAKIWSTNGSHRVVHAAQHLHGGIGVDTDYPVHRTFRWAKHLEFSFGSARAHVAELGQLIAAD